MLDGLRQVAALGPYSLDEWIIERARYAALDDDTTTTTSIERLACEVALEVQIQSQQAPSVVAIFEGGAELGVRIRVSGYPRFPGVSVAVARGFVRAMAATAVETAIREHSARRLAYRGCDVAIDDV